MSQQRSDLYQRALSFLARRDHSRRELQRKLLRYAPSFQVGQILDRLEEKGLLDDEAFALQRALSCRRRRLWGSQRIRLDLERLGINARIIRRLLEQIDEEKSELESIKELVGSRLEKTGHPQTPTDLKRLYDYCLRAGYPPNVIRKELDPYFRQIDWSGQNWESK